jgi:hypothetical protein
MEPLEFGGQLGSVEILVFKARPGFRATLVQMVQQASKVIRELLDKPVCKALQASKVILALMV